MSGSREILERILKQNISTTTLSILASAGLVGAFLLYYYREKTRPHSQENNFSIEQKKLIPNKIFNYRKQIENNDKCIINSGNIIVIDIGGTNFRSAVFNPIKVKMSTEIKVTETPNIINHRGRKINEIQCLVIKKIIEVINEYCKQNSALTYIGISFPGPVNSAGVIRSACTIFGENGKEFPLLAELSRQLPDKKFFIANDMTAAATYYGLLYKYRMEHSDFLQIITLSTGIGGKIYDLKNGKVLLDNKGIGGEIGHAIVDFSKEAPICDCGGKGHLNALSSGRGIEKLTRMFSEKYEKDFKKSCLNNKNVTSKNISEAILEEDEFSLKILDYATYHMAISIMHVSANIGINKFILIGGFIRSIAEPYKKYLERNLNKVDFYGRDKNKIPKLIEIVETDEQECLHGIGLLTYNRYKEELYKNLDNFEDKLVNCYLKLQSSANEKGVTKGKVKDKLDMFFKCTNSGWQVHEALWKPTGIVLGYPFEKSLNEKIVKSRDHILKELGLQRSEYWILEEDNLHSTIVSYSHYSEQDVQCINNNFPDSEVKLAEKIFSEIEPISITFNGFVITEDGSLLLKGYSTNGDLLSLRTQLKDKIKGITQKIPDIIHVKLAQILTPVTQQEIMRINLLYSSIFISEEKFTCAKLYNRKKLYFKNESICDSSKLLEDSKRNNNIVPRRIPSLKISSSTSRHSFIEEIRNKPKNFIINSADSSKLNFNR